MSARVLAHLFAKLAASADDYIDPGQSRATTPAFAAALSSKQGPMKPATQPGQPAKATVPANGVPRLPSKPAVPAALPKPVAQPTTSAAQAGYVQPNLTQFTSPEFRNALQAKQ